MYSQQKICLDVQTTQVQSFVNVRKNDTLRQLIFNFVDGGKQFLIPNTFSVVLRAKKPDGTVLYNNCIVNDNTATYTFTSQTVSSVGVVQCEATVYDNGHYEKLNTDSAPTFPASNDKYYSKSGETYTLLASQPSDWTTNWTNYYEFIRNIITSPKFAINVGETLYSDSEVESESEFTALQTAITNASNVNISASKSGTTSTVTVTDRNGTSTSVNINDGTNGQDGEDGSDGRGIVSIAKTSTSGLKDTYTITFTDGTTSTFKVTNGANGQDGQNGQDGADGRDGQDGQNGADGISVQSGEIDASGHLILTMSNGTTVDCGHTKGDTGATGTSITNIAKTSTSGKVDTYTITFSNGNTTTFTVTNGNDGTNGTNGVGIYSITKISTVGLVDTYRITYTNGNTQDYTVTNGQSGATTWDAITGKPTSFNPNIKDITYAQSKGAHYLAAYDEQADENKKINVASVLSLGANTLNYSGLNTTDKTIVGAINEQNNDIANKLSGVQINGTDLTIDANKKVTIPLASNNQSDPQNSIGLVCTADSLGVGANRNFYGRLYVVKATDAEINAKNQQYHPIVPYNMQYAWGVCESSAHPIKTTMDNVAVANAQYDLGTQTTLTITLPSATSMQEIYVAFKSESTATTLNIVGTYEGDTSYVPSANKICELHFKYVCSTWVLVTKETSVTV